MQLVRTSFALLQSMPLLHRLSDSKHCGLATEHAVTRSDFSQADVA